MSFKYIIAMIGSYIALKIADKFIKDNLPDLHYKNLIRLFNQYVVPFLLLAYIGYLYVIANITNDPKLKKQLFNLLVAVVAIAAIDKIKQQNNNQTA
jgi:ABC-type uncharacterized transport system permease subunit